MGSHAPGRTAIIIACLAKNTYSYISAGFGTAGFGTVLYLRIYACFTSTAILLVYCHTVQTFEGQNAPKFCSFFYENAGNVFAMNFLM